MNQPNPPAWKTESLGSICRSSGGSIQTGPFGSQLHAEDYKEDGIPIITVEHLADGQIVHRNLPLVGDADYKRLCRYRLETGDLVFSRVGAIDRCAFVSEAENGWLFSGRCLRVRPGDGEVEGRYLSYLLNSWKQRQWILNHSVGSTMACLNTTILSSVPIDFPVLSEQRKIAWILTTADNLIEKTEALIAKYQATKQGMMHDLFTRGVDEHGHLRPSFAEAPDLYMKSELGWIPMEWTTRTLGELVSPSRPIAYGILMPGYGHPGGVPVIKVKDIKGGRVDESDLLLTSREIDFAYRRSRVQPGDLLFTIRGTVGRTAFVPQSLAGANITQDTARIGIVVGDARFVRGCLEMPIPSQFIGCHTLGVAVQGINLRDVRRIRVAFPPAIEQERVGDMIDTDDAVIYREQQHLDKLLKEKIGVMQDLLTGKVRVKVDEAEEVVANG
jgi:type I restriction enzyme, S subunit